MQHGSGITIGLDRRQYAERRNIVLPNATTGVILQQVPSLPDSHDFGANYSRFAYRPSRVAGIDAFHLFNSIPLQDECFVVTTEAGLPRWWGAPPEIVLQGWRQLASPACGRIFAISQNAAAMVLNDLAACPQALRQDIEAKLTVLYPPQELPAAPNKDKFATSGPLRLAFVGRDFLRKGGYEFVCALHTLMSRQIPFHATIISEMRLAGLSASWDQDGHRRLAQASAIMAALGERVSFHEGLQNSRVLEVFSRSHLAVLPSFGEPFGYAVLEAQSRLCPVLTSNVRAFPEINDSTCGWTIKLPLTPLGTLAHGAMPFAELSARVAGELAETLTLIAERGIPAIRQKALAARERVRRQHDPAAAGKRLLGAYQALRPRARASPWASPAPRRRALWVTANFAPQIGGLQTYTASMIAALAEDMDVVLATDATQSPPRDTRIGHLPLADLDAADTAAGMARTGRELSRAVEASGADIVHFANANMAVYRRFLPPALPVVATVHGNDLTAPWQRTGDADAALLVRAGLAACERIIAVSRHTAALIDQANIQARVSVIQNSCDLGEFFPAAAQGAAFRQRHGIAPDTIVLLTLARLVGRKGHATVIAALSRLAHPGRALCWLVAGDGPWRARLEALAAAAAPAARIIFIGQVEPHELCGVYNACDFFVLVPSAFQHGPMLDSEGFGIAFLEAAACAKPAIGADLAGCRDAIVSGHTGLLIPPDDADALAAAIAFLADDAVARVALGNYALAALRACDGWPGIAARVRRIYAEVLTDGISSVKLLGQTCA